MADKNGSRIHLPPGSRNLPKGLRFAPKRKEFFVDIWANGKRIREYVGPNRRSAEAILAKKRSEIAEGKYLDKKKVIRTTFQEVAKKYNEWAKTHKKSYESSVKHTLKQLLGVFGEYRLSDLSPSKIEDYIAEKRNRAKPSTCNRHLALLSHMFTKASDWEMWNGENPCRKIKKLREDNGRMRFLSDEERDLLLESCEGPLHMFVLAALDTGARKNELLQLHWNEVGIDNGTITILDRHSKSGRARVIPMTKRLKEALRSLPSRFRGGFVFTHSDGQSLLQPKGDSTYLRREYKKALSKAGISDFTIHDLRHDFGSRLAAQDAHPKTIQELMGHSTLHMTMRYTHFSTTQKQSAISLLDVPTNRQTGSETDKGEAIEATPFL
jgi:integrase